MAYKSEQWHCRSLQCNYKVGRVGHSHELEGDAAQLLSLSQ